MGIALSNRKRRLPSFSVEVEDLVAGRPLDKRCYFLKLPAGRTQETAYRHQLARRGRHQLTGFRLSTKFPFGLIQKSRDVADAHELLIYPALVNVPEAVLRGFPATHGLGRHKLRSRSGEFAGLRDFRPGDDPRDIHWRTTARRGVPLVRESEDDEGLDATLLFDNRLGEGVGREAFEEAVSLAASVATVLLQRGYRVGFGARATEIPPDGGAAQRSRILGFLALVEPAVASAAMQGGGRRGARIQIRAGLAPIVETGSGRNRAPQTGTAGPLPRTKREGKGAMRFQATHKLMSYLLVLSALGALASSDALSPLTALAFMTVGGLSWFADTGSAPARIVDRLAAALRAAVVAIFLLSAWQVWRRLPDPDLTPVLNLVMFLLTYKLFHRRANRDYLHIYILSFLIVLAAAAMAQSFLFAVAFALYVVLATWTLILFHLRREMEENYLIKHSSQAPSQKVGVNRILNSRRVVGGSFLASTGVVALAVFGGSVATFAFVPRIGAGFVLGSPRTTRNMVGFSDEVALGQYGILSTDNQVVALRATIPAIAALPGDRRDREIERLYWRGTVYDSYDRGHWVRSRQPELRTHLEQLGTRYLVGEPTFEAAHSPHAAAHDAIAADAADPHHGAADATAPPEAAGLGRGPHGIIRQEIDVVGLSVPVAFAIDHPVGFELPATKIGTLTEMRLAPRWSGEVALRISPLDLSATDGDDVHAYAGTHYIAYSRDAMSMVRAGAGRPLRDLDAAAVAPFLALPPSLSPRVIELAKKITAGRTNAPAKLLAIIDWLRTTHEYTTNLQRNPAIADPLEDFLFEQKAGHCEYFASATAVLLRASGVPSRYINGFLGGEWNEIGHYVAVRENRAHSWAEAYMGELGWMRVDATPPNRSLFRMGRLRQVFDSIDFFWGRWVVGYDLGRQIELARRLGHGLGGGADDADPRPSKFPWAKTGAVAAIALALSTLGWRWRRRRWSPTAPQARRAALSRGAGSPVGRLYEKALRHLARRGLPRRPSETPREFAARVAASGVRGSDILDHLTELYTHARFGRRAIADEPLRALAARLSELGRARAAVAVSGAAAAPPTGKAPSSGA